MIIKMSDDSEFKCIRRIGSNLGMSMPVSDEDILNLSQFRRIEKSISKAFDSDLQVENERLREMLAKSNSLLITTMLISENGDYNATEKVKRIKFQKNAHVNPHILKVDELLKHNEVKPVTEVSQ